MIRFLGLLLLVALVWWLVRRAGSSASTPEPPPAAGPKQSPPLRHETMVACAFCQVHLPQGEALWLGERAFCDEAHRQAFLKADPPA